ncbi:type VI secretion system-associated protein TagF [Caballeronia sp. INDeC2]|uniref:type VI secretion system-associated protein TagF n=1 Tax=Caballeronia sp. INDeC2 TaxID=2921747 RepID=UPI002028D1ED|nr:type VI secretion system-associated protein TagF [Caballeronia sp. INDeC2]
MNVRDRIGAGFYGKVRTHGDFVGRGLSDVFVERWDAWLQHGLLAARKRHPDDWLERYLAMPVWRFCASASVVDECACAGVLMPGIDAVGRYFPFVIAQRIDGESRPGASSWHDEACALALSTLAPSFSLTVFEKQLTVLRTQPFYSVHYDGGSAWWTGRDETHVHEGALDAGLFLHLLDDAD